MYNYKKAIFMASALLCLNMTAAAQQVSLNVNKVSVKQAMNQLKEKKVILSFSRRLTSTTNRLSAFPQIMPTSQM